MQRGDLIPGFELASGNRPGRIGPWDYKQRSNLVVLIFHGAACEPCRNLLGEITKDYAELRVLNAEVLAVSGDAIEQLREVAHELDVPFPLLGDESGAVRAAYLGPDTDAGEVAVFVADRFGALFTATRAAEADGLPRSGELQEWLLFIEIQCEECHPPEW